MEHRAIRQTASLVAAIAASVLAQAAAPAGADGEDTAVASPAQKADPGVAKEHITRALRDSAEVAADAISVNVHADTVVLSGEVDTQAQAARALSLAQQHGDGVRVSSHIEVRPEAPTPARTAASTLVQDVEHALKQDQRTANLGVSVTVDDAQVIGLHGLVPSRESRAAAEEIAARVNGVQRINSRLVVPGE